MKETEWFHGLSTDEARVQRCYIRSAVLMSMAAVVLLGIVFFASRASAQDLPLHEHESDGVHVKLMPGPCVNPISLAMVGVLKPREQALEWHSVKSTWRMSNGANQDFGGCWAADGEAFLILFDDFSQYKVKRSVFNRAKGQTGT